MGCDAKRFIMNQVLVIGLVNTSIGPIGISD